MVTQAHQKKTLFTCDACGFNYLTRELAQQCEDYCRKNKSCSLEITKHAVELP